MKFSHLFLSATLIAGALSPVSVYAQSRNKEGKGALIGAVLGAVIGNKAGKGDAGSTIIGAAVGGILGAAIGSELDEQEQNEIRRTHNDCLERNERRRRYQTAHSDVTFVILQDGYYRREPSRMCRSYESTIRIGNRMERSRGYACRDEYGNWSEVRETEIVYGVYNEQPPYLTPGTVVVAPPPPPPVMMRQCLIDPGSGYPIMTEGSRVISYYGSSVDCQLALQNARGPVVCVSRNGSSYAINLTTMTAVGFLHPNIISCVSQFGERRGGR